MQAFFFIINLTLGKYDGTCFNYGAVSSDELCDYLGRAIYDNKK